MTPFSTAGQPPGADGLWSDRATAGHELDNENHAGHQQEHVDEAPANRSDETE